MHLSAKELILCVILTFDVSFLTKYYHKLAVHHSITQINHLFLNSDIALIIVENVHKTAFDRL